MRARRYPTGKHRARDSLDQEGREGQHLIGDVDEESAHSFPVAARRRRPIEFLGKTRAPERREVMPCPWGSQRRNQDGGPPVKRSSGRVTGVSTAAGSNDSWCTGRTSHANPVYARELARRRRLSRVAGAVTADTRVDLGRTAEQDAYFRWAGRPIRGVEASPAVAASLRDRFLRNPQTVAVVARASPRGGDSPLRVSRAPTASALFAKWGASREACRRGRYGGRALDHRRPLDSNGSATPTT